MGVAKLLSRRRGDVAAPQVPTPKAEGSASSAVRAPVPPSPSSPAGSRYQPRTQPVLRKALAETGPPKSAGSCCSVQRKPLSVSQPGDRLEIEADRAADHVMRMPDHAPTISAAATAPQRKCAACEAEESVQATTAPTGAADVTAWRDIAWRETGGTDDDGPDDTMAPDDLGGLGGVGQPLDPTLRDTFEPRFGVSLAGARVHTGQAAAAAAKSLKARAFTVGKDIYFGDGQFQPGSHDGQKLLAHELAHYVQQSGGTAKAPRPSDAQPDPERDAEMAAEQEAKAPQDDNAERIAVVSSAEEAIQRKPSKSGSGTRWPPPTVRQISMVGYTYHLKQRPFLRAGEEGPQLLEILFEDLYKQHSSQQFAEKVYARFKRPIFSPAERTIAKGERKRPDKKIVFAHPSIIAFMDSIEKQDKIKPAINQSKIRFIHLGYHGYASYGYTKKHLPGWYTKSMYLNILQRHGTALRAFAAVNVIQTPSNQVAASKSAEKKKEAAAKKILAELKPAANTLEVIRKDASLIAHPAYRKLWPVAQGGQADDKAWIAFSEGLKALRFLEEEPELAKRARSKDAKIAVLARKEVADRIARIFNVPLTSKTPKASEAVLMGKPSKTQVKLPPYPASLRVLPQPLPPANQVAVGATFMAIMNIRFPNLWAAFPYRKYTFELIHIPLKKVKQGKSTGTDLPTQEASAWKTLKHRLARDARYHEEDVRHVYGEWRVLFGLPGATIPDPLAMNAALRYAGTIIKSGFEVMADDPWTARMHCPKEGAYLLRATARWSSEPTADFRRPPSVAYLPLFATAPDLLADSQLKQQVDERKNAVKRIKDIAKERKAPNADTKKLDAEEARMKAVAGGAQGLLEYQRTELSKQLTTAKADPRKARATKALKSRIKQIDEILAVRKKRGLDATSERLLSTFVSDEGHVIQLLLEAKELSKPTDTVKKWQVFDSTSPKGKQAEGTGADKNKALFAAWKALLMRGGYGRGQASVLIGGVAYSKRITLAGTELLKETLSNASLVLSIVAIAAAPATSGASMALMVPAGIIGAIPSVMNIVERNIDQTFKFDLETALDVVNVVGAALQITPAIKGASLAAKVGKVVYVTVAIGNAGTGVILLGADLVRQLEELELLDPELRAARMMEILGNVMLQAGIMVGSHLALKGKLASGEKPGANKVRSIEEWWTGLSDETKKWLDDNPKKKQQYMKMKPSVRDLLTLCASFCLIDPPPNDFQQKKIEAISQRLSAPDQRWLKTVLHEKGGGTKLTKLLYSLGKMSDSKLVESLKKRTDAASAILLNFSEKVKGVKDPAKNSAAQNQLRAKAEAVFNKGAISIDQLGRILDHVRQTKGGDPLKTLTYLENLSDAKSVPGFDKVVGDLTGHRYFHQGAHWVIEYLTKKNMWKQKGLQFEVENEGGTRRWDVRVSGYLYQFKSWSNFYEAKFKQQIVQDYSESKGFTNRDVRWAFEIRGSIKSKKVVVKAMETLLDQWKTEPNCPLKPKQIDRIKKYLPQMVVVGT